MPPFGPGAGLNEFFVKTTLMKCMSNNKVSDEPPDVYLYNPLRPVPTVGGQAIMPDGNAMGPRDQRVVETRDDVLVYSTGTATLFTTIRRCRLNGCLDRVC